MAFDGIVIAGLVHELNQTILNTKISKIAQPENDELLLTCKGSSGQFRVSISANASLPFLYLTDTNKTSPLQAPTFCMVLRKHIANGRIISITQPHMERIIHLKIEHLNEMGDLCHKTLVIELMGKHSNIIFCDEDGTIIDSIKHVSSAVSSLREVLPGRPYFIPATQEDKFNAMTMDATQICDAIKAKPMSICKAIYTTLPVSVHLLHPNWHTGLGWMQISLFWPVPMMKSTISQTTLHGFLMKSATTNFIR